MNRENTKKAAEVMLAFVAGEEIEFRRCDSLTWYLDTDPTWDWDAYDYRVKPKAPPTYFAVDYSLPARRSAAQIGPLHDCLESAKTAQMACVADGFPARVIELQEVVR